ncbi:unnamed protein product [Cercospora beticola]|nr:unnamed protein product [Cercospora beticola]
MSVTELTQILVHTQQGATLQQDANTRLMEQSDQILSDEETGPESTVDSPGGEIQGEEDFEVVPAETAPQTSQDDAGNLAHEAVDELQARREQEYIQFVDYNSPDDYTDGPARFVERSDGVKDCAALLLTFDMSVKIIEASEIQRQYAREARHAEEQMKEISRFESELSSEILNHRARISHEEARDEEQEATAACLTKLRADLIALEDMLEGLEVRKQELEASLRWRGEMLTEAQAEVAMQLDEAFVAGNLLAPDTEEEIPVEYFDLQDQYQKLHRQQTGEEEEEDDDHMSQISALVDVSTAYLRDQVAALSAEQAAEVNVRSKLNDAMQRWLTAEQRFDYKEVERAQDWHATKVGWQRGDPTQDANQEAFDLRWYQNFQAITRELVEAEHEYHQARVAACEAGLEPDVMQEECFADCASDGRCDSEAGHDEIFWERFAAMCKDDGKVNQWLDAVPDDMCNPQDAKTEPEIDEWEARDIEVWESQSTVATHAIVRRRIDQRQQEVGWHDRIWTLWDGLAAFRAFFFN